MNVYIIPQLSAPDMNVDTTQCKGYERVDSSAQPYEYKIDDDINKSLQEFFNRQPIHLALSMEAGAELVR